MCMLVKATLVSALSAMQSKHFQFDCINAVNIKTDVLVPTVCYECAILCMHSTHIAAADAPHAGLQRLSKKLI